MKSIRKRVMTGLLAIMLGMLTAVGGAIAADSITGTITEKGDIIVLDAADGSYVLEGNDTAPDMVGKTVKVTGTVAEKDNMKVINVLSMEEVKE
jgi:hypothetical protein